MDNDFSAKVVESLYQNTMSDFQRLVNDMNDLSTACTEMGNIVSSQDTAGLQGSWNNLSGLVNEVSGATQQVYSTIGSVITEYKNYKIANEEEQVSSVDNSKNAAEDFKNAVSSIINGSAVAGAGAANTNLSRDYSNDEFYDYLDRTRPNMNGEYTDEQGRRHTWFPGDPDADSNGFVVTNPDGSIYRNPMDPKYMQEDMNRIGEMSSQGKDIVQNSAWGNIPGENTQSINLNSAPTEAVSDRPSGMGTSSIPGNPGNGQEPLNFTSMPTEGKTASDAFPVIDMNGNYIGRDGKRHNISENQINFDTTTTDYTRR